MKTSASLQWISAVLLVVLGGCAPASSGTGGSGGSSSATGGDGGVGGSTSTTTTTTDSGTTGTITAPPDGDATYAAVTAAEAFLASLTDDQRAKVELSFDDDAQRTHWSNLPTGLFARNGLKIGDMSADQETALFAMLAALLSADGYDQIRNIVDADEALKASSGGGNLTFGEAEYFVSVLGTPSATSPWMVQFGGHHLAINVTIAGGDMTLGPSLTGAQPASFVLNGVTVRPQGVERDKAYALIGSLSAAQQSKAIISATYMDLSLGPGKDGVVLTPEGIVATDLDADQKTALRDLIGLRAGILNEEDAAVRMTEIEANLDQTYFAWAGPTDAASPAYYRITGPTVAIEYSPQALGGDATDHTHAMYREPSNDYGASWLK